MTSWPVVPICELQRLDVREEDLLNGGAGYDRLPYIANRRLGVDVDRAKDQFVVQLYGCPLDCWYCYVTPDGVAGTWRAVSALELRDAFIASGCSVFHLMGGAPALYLSRWRELAGCLPSYALFHSDFLGVESLYDPDDLRGLPGLHAFNVKNTDDVTGYDVDLVVENLRRLRASDVDFYLTFTNLPGRPDWLSGFDESLFDDSYYIPIKDYRCLRYR